MKKNILHKKAVKQSFYVFLAISVIYLIDYREYVIAGVKASFHELIP